MTAPSNLSLALVDEIAWALESVAVAYLPEAARAASTAVEQIVGEFGAVPVDYAFASPAEQHAYETARDAVAEAIEPWLGHDERAAAAVLTAARRLASLS